MINKIIETLIKYMNEFEKTTIINIEFNKFPDTFPNDFYVVYYRNSEKEKINKIIIPFKNLISYTLSKQKQNEEIFCKSNKKIDDKENEKLEGKIENEK